MKQNRKGFDRIFFLFFFAPPSSIKKETMDLGKNPLSKEGGSPVRKEGSLGSGTGQIKDMDGKSKMRTWSYQREFFFINCQLIDWYWCRLLVALENYYCLGTYSTCK